MDTSKPDPTPTLATGPRDVCEGERVAQTAHNVVPLVRTVIPFSRRNYSRPQSGPGDNRSDAARLGEDDDLPPSAA